MTLLLSLWFLIRRFLNILLLVAITIRVPNEMNSLKKTLVRHHTWNILSNFHQYMPCGFGKHPFKEIDDAQPTEGNNYSSP